MNALFDLGNGIYTDLVVQREHEKNECRALCQMAERSRVFGIRGGLSRMVRPCPSGRSSISPSSSPPAVGSSGDRLPGVLLPYPAHDDF